MVCEEKLKKDSIRAMFIKTGEAFVTGGVSKIAGTEVRRGAWEMIRLGTTRDVGNQTWVKHTGYRAALK